MFFQSVLVNLLTSENHFSEPYLKSGMLHKIQIGRVGTKGLPNLFSTICPPMLGLLQQTRM